MTQEQKKYIAEMEDRLEEVKGRASVVDATVTAMTREAMRAARQGTYDEAHAALQMQAWAESLHAKYGEVLIRTAENVYTAVNTALPEMTPEESAHYRDKYGN